MEPNQYDLDPELAKANVLRLRGEFDAAKAQCLSVLRKSPENETANLLMGDICQDAGDPQQAEDWYRTALDIDPNSKLAKSRLDELIAARAATVIASAEQQIGVPVGRGHNRYLFPFLLGLFLLFVIALAYLVGRKLRVDEYNAIRTDPVMIPEAPPVARMAPEVPREENVEKDSAPAIKSSSELDVREALGLQDLQHVQEVRINPTSHAVHITLKKLSIEEERETAARAIAAVFERLLDVPRVLIYVTRDGQSTSAADVRRQQFEALPKESTPLSQLVAEKLLPEQWPPPEPAPSESVPATNETTG